MDGAPTRQNHTGSKAGMVWWDSAILCVYSCRHVTNYRFRFMIQSHIFDTVIHLCHCCNLVPRVLFTLVLWGKAIRHDRIIGLLILLCMCSTPCFNKRTPKLVPRGRDPFGQHQRNLDRNELALGTRLTDATILGLPVLFQRSLLPVPPLDKGKEDSGNEIANVADLLLARSARITFHKT